ncbi:hypothetical protein TSUD_177250 [Trifolium subterraneum]|uniref:RNase H type-1 domain-containing protein n=1 Tax=Trifolium subterraneum TaxID=3900 RepID=A0A2Z6P0X3_TRISU|nr:hypothetical protein TSUD_177250 [Trifolium subterraneum]
MQNGFKILTPRDMQHNLSKVSDMITTQPFIRWNNNIIDKVFLPFEREIIKKIPLIQEPLEDQLMWPYSKDGTYTVKTGYNVLKHWQDSTANGSTTNSHSHIWKKLWTLPTIPRNKTLLWRIYQQALPVRSALNKRGIQCTIVCPRCLHKEETINHVFMECHRAAKIWFGSKLGIRFDNNHRNFTDWLTHNIINLEKKDLSYIASIIYGIWYARNSQVFDNKDIDDRVVIDKALENMLEYQMSIKPEQTIQQNLSNNNQSRPNHRPSNRWTKPNQGTIKGNCDANLSVEGRWGLGVVFRDEDGEVLATATWELPGYNDPETAEACAIYHAIRLAADCCFQQVIIESDCTNIIRKINDPQIRARSYLGNYVWGINCNRGNFRICLFNHISRKANGVAHVLAKMAHSEPNRVWLEEAHPNIVPFLLRDLVH